MKLTITVGQFLTQIVEDIAWETKYLFSPLNNFLKNIKEGKDAKIYFEEYSEEELFVWQKDNGQIRFAIQRDNGKFFEILMDILIDKDLFIRTWENFFSESYSFVEMNPSSNWIQK
jgi:hypothetical protein